jgi:predicted DNA-binding transcriptional regulator YafY
MPEPGDPTNIGKDLLSRLRSILDDQLGETSTEHELKTHQPEPHTHEELPEGHPPVEGPPDINTIKLRIQQAARQGVLLYIEYQKRGGAGSVPRFVEPYSYRPSKNSPNDLFMGFCHKDNRIESMILERIKVIQVTETPFKPKWPIEIS